MRELRVDREAAVRGICQCGECGERFSVERPTCPRCRSFDKQPPTMEAPGRLEVKR